MSTTGERHPVPAPTSAPMPSMAPSAALSADPADVRASDRDREATVARLHQALGAGRLDLDETDERTAAAYAARYRSQLGPLVADLPHPHPATSGPPAWAGVWTAAVWRARTTFLGDEGAATEPTTGQCRTAVVLTALVVLWMTACAFLGAMF